MDRAAPATELPTARGTLLLSATFVLAFCSIVYELLLGQTLAAFLGHTVLRYSVTIGLYMLAMGIGAMLAQRRVLSRPLVALQRVELALTLLGGASVMLLFVVDGLGAPRPLLWTLAHGVILVIGVLSGLEIPLLIEIGTRERRRASHSVLGIDYVGAFAGTIAFAFLFYPRLGIVATAFAVAAANAATGLVLAAFARPDDGLTVDRRLLATQAAMLVGLLVCLTFSSDLAELGLRLYLDA